MAKKTTKKSVPLSKKPLVKKPFKATKATTAPKSTKKIVKKPASAPKPVKVVKKARVATPVLETKPTPRKPALAKAPAKTPVAKIPAVTVAVKPGRNAAGLNAKDVLRYRELLLTKRRELLGDVSSMEDEALRNSGGSNLSNLPIHMADMGTDNYEQEFTLGLVEKDRRILREIHAALVKLQEGTYGICEGTGKPIAKARLEAQPWTRYSIEHARKLEQQRVRPT